MTQATLRIPSVTGVDVTLRIAGPGGRSYAFVIDWHIRVLAALAWLLVAMLLLVGSFNPDNFAVADGSGLALFGFMPSLAIYFLYHPVLEVLMHGRTPGKRMAGVRVLKRDGSVPGIGALLIRNVFRLIDSLPFAYGIGLAATMLTEQAVRIGDLAADTILVYDDAPDSVLSAISGAAIGRLGLARAELVRDLLDRWPELDPRKRDGLGQQVLEALGQADETLSGEQLRRTIEELIR